MNRHSKKLISGALVAILILGTPILAWACSVPVFRYALEMWPPDEYEVVLFHQGPLNKEQKQLLWFIWRVGPVTCILLSPLQKQRI